MGDIKTELEWTYKPSDYFEERTVWDRGSYFVEIDAGRIIALMEADFYDSKPELRDFLTKELGYYFYGALPIRRRPFEISRGSITRLSPDGKRDITFEVQAASYVLIGADVDLIHKDSNGNIIGDTRRERIDATKKLAELTGRYAASDPTVRRILDSFDAAVRFPGSVFVYLYEVWEALKTRFRGAKKAQDALGINNDDRSALTKLANEEPVNQGRHRGKFAGKLREATADELNECWKITRSMLEKYLNYLNKRDMA